MKVARHGKRVRLTPDDINLALQMRGAEPVYGYTTASSDASRAAIKEVQDGVSYVVDRDIELVKLISQPIPKPPADISFTGEAPDVHIVL